MSGIDIKNLKKNYKIAITLFCDYLLIIVLSLPISYLISRGMVNANIYDFIVTITISSTASLLLLLLIGFYKHSIRSYESRLTLLSTLFAAALFGFLNAVQIYQNFNNDFFYILIISSLGFAAINLARDIAGSILNRYQKQDSAENIIITVQAKLESSYIEQ